MSEGGRLEGGGLARLQLIRHADALSRSTWTEHDGDRPLTSKGERQAAELVESVVATGPIRLLSSPARRCLATLEPIADRTGLAIEETVLLGEGASPRGALDLLLGTLRGEGAGASGRASGSEGAVRGEVAVRSEGAVVACTHGDVLDGLLEDLGRLGVALSVGPGMARLVTGTGKAGRVELTVEDGEVIGAHLISPPEVEVGVEVGEAAGKATGGPKGR